MKPSPVPALLLTLALAGCATSAALVSVPDVPHARSPAPGIVTAGRLGAADIERLRASGVRHVIDLTPDAETPNFDEASAVRDAGLRYVNLPVRGAADLDRDNVRAFDALLRNARGPVLVHCASGNRVGAMAALRAAWVEGRPLEEAVAIGKAWGLGGLEAEVRKRLAKGAAVGMP